MPETAFQQARHAYAGIVGSALSERDLWRRVAIAALAAVVVLAAVMAWMYTRAGLVPYVIELGPDGREIRARLAREYEPSDAIYRDLARAWIQMVRRVSHDPFVMQQDVLWAYERTSGPARTKLNGFFQARGGLTPSDQRSRSIDAVVVIKQSADTFQIDWAETLYSRHGERIATERWRALATFEHHKPATDAAIRRNGLGLFIVDFEWQRV
jgi:type IV secretion system protein VirB5